MFSKKAIVVSTAAGKGAKSATKDITTALFYWGIPYIKTYGISVQAMNWESVKEKIKLKIQNDTAKIATKILNKKNVKPGLKTKAIFMLMRAMQKANFGSGDADKFYWEKLGWLDKERPWHKKIENK